MTDPPEGAELHQQDDDRSWPETYRGTCPACRLPVSAMDEGGACLHRGGVWHPWCRDAGRNKNAQESLL